jgi:UDP-glucose 4-epimerase
MKEFAERKIRYIYFSSGGTVYGRNNSIQIAEEEPCRPINFYGYSKLMFEEYIGLAHRMHGLKYLVIRPSNPYGPHQNPANKQGVVSVFIDRVLKDEAIEIWGDGSVVRDYIWITDMTNALTNVLSKELWNTTINIGSGVGHTVNEVVAIIETVTKKTAKIVFKEARTVDVARIVLDVSKLKNEIDFYPTSLSEGIQLYCDTLTHDATK